MMNLKKKLDKILRRLPKRKETTVETPSSWLKDKQKIKLSSSIGLTELVIKKKGKRRIPLLRTVKRLLAATLLIINFFISQASLMSAAASQPLFLLFILNSFIMLDYLWKTRKKPELPEMFQR